MLHFQSRTKIFTCSCCILQLLIINIHQKFLFNYAKKKARDNKFDLYLTIYHLFYQRHSLMSCCYFLERANNSLKLLALSHKSGGYKLMSYWDINQFLAEEEKVQFNLSQESYFLDFLDPTKEGVIHAGQTTTAHLWLVNTLFDYLQMSDNEIKVLIPEDFHVKSLDRINSFRSSHRSTVEQVRIKKQMPYFYEIYEAMKKITANQTTKFSGEKIGQFLEERGKLAICRASGIFEQCKADPVTNNYTKLQMDLYKMTRDKALEYHSWKTM